MVGKYGLFIALAAVIVAVTNAKPPQKIIGGSPASLGEFPYMVALRLNGVHLCGGTIIGKRHVITAAHCIAGIVSRPYTGFEVVTGTVSGGSGTKHPVKAIHYHAGYNTFSQSSPNDVAIITLASDIKFDQYTQKVSMPSSATPSGVTASVAGWGYTSANSGVPSNILLKIQVKVLAADDCAKYLTGISQLYTHQICTRDAPGRGVCSGDSGGPLVYNGQFIGVVSYVIPCGLGYPDVYTSVYHYLDWIEQTMALA